MGGSFCNLVLGSVNRKAFLDWLKSHTETEFPCSFFLVITDAPAAAI